MDIGTRIKQLREQRNLSQEALAGELNISRQAVAKWESGASLPGTANMLGLCRVFGISMDELTCPEKNKASKSISRAMRVTLLVISTAFLFISVLALIINRNNALPDNVIGYADMQTGILVTGTPVYLYALCGLTVLLIAATAFVYIRSARGRREDKK